MTPLVSIKVFGVGGSGGNTINYMRAADFEGVEFIAVNTDAQALSLVNTEERIQIGNRLTRGLGAGGDPNVGFKALEENRDDMNHFLQETDMVFITCGMGGGTGTGAAPALAQMAKSQGALTVGVVTRPFLFEGKRRKDQADAGIQRMLNSVDTLIVISNDRLLQSVKGGLAVKDAFKEVDNVLFQAIQGISDIINIPGLINVDFADVKAIMSDAGVGVMGVGISSTEVEHPAVEAVKNAIQNPLLEYSIDGAVGVVFNITSGQDLSLHEINQAAEVIYNTVNPDANVIFGTVIDENMKDSVKVTVIAIVGKHL
ncbi:MAG: cell division protein FtsZ [Candidatus Sericytochromatia bacterium]|nr:cell division protein FtsZ [Candidatus Sericytochromatia bacterium]